MARPKTPKRCFTCREGNLFWRKFENGSVRLVTSAGNVHYCPGSKYRTADSAGTPPDMPAPTPAPFNPAPTPITPEPEVQPEPQPEPIAGEIYARKSELADAIKRVDRDANAMFVMFSEEIARINANRPTVQELHIIRPDSEPVIVTNAHPMMAELLADLSIGLNVLLCGPAGSGKSYAGDMVAAALSLPFYPFSVGPQTSKSDLLGYMDGHGRYVSSLLRQAYEFGGVFLLDEVDAGNPGVLTVLNAMLANKKAGFPDGKVIERHANFRCIAAANTYGTGANRMYVGRQQLDAATLDRFSGLDWGYDPAIEVLMSEGNSRWLTFVRALRAKAESLQMRVLFGPRKIAAGAKMLNAGQDIERVKAKTVFFGLSADDMAKLSTVVY